MNCGTHIVPKQINAMLAGCTNVVSMAVSDSVESAIRHMCVDGHVGVVLVKESIHCLKKKKSFFEN